jgi:ribosomal protein L37AE/L43A
MRQEDYQCPECGSDEWLLEDTDDEWRLSSKIWVCLGCRHQESEYYRALKARQDRETRNGS